MKLLTLTVSFIFIILLFYSFDFSSAHKQENKISLYGEEKPVTNVKKDEKDIVTIAIASIISPSESFYKYDYLKKFLENNMNVEINLVQKQTYQEVNKMLKNGQVDFGFICSLSYVLGMKEGYLQGVVAPEIAGSTLYRSYTIVSNDSPYHSLPDLEEKDFAFADPVSYSGRLSLLIDLNKLKKDANDFFNHIYYTYSHDYSIKSVAFGVVDGASVDGLLYDAMKQTNPELISKTRVIGIGESTGVPPFVASIKTSEEKILAFKNALLSLDRNEQGRKVLSELGVDRYVEINNQNYNNIFYSLYLLGDAYD